MALTIAPRRRGGEGMLVASLCFDRDRAKGNRASEGFVVGGGGGLSPAESGCAESDPAKN
jgi:hypothetical protein